MALASVAISAHADSWRTAASLYGQLGGMNGHTLIGGTRTDVDVSFSDLLDHLDAAGMMAIRSERERWALGVNVVFLGLDAEASDAGGTFYDVDVTQDLTELTWSWRFDERYELFAGARYQSLATEVTLARADGTRDERLEVADLLDPIVGARAAWQVADHWDLIVRADIGGFGVGSDLTWSGLALVDWTVAKNFGVVLGYRALDTDYSRGSAAGRFEFDILVSGPLLGIRYDFSP